MNSTVCKCCGQPKPPTSRPICEACERVGDEPQKWEGCYDSSWKGLITDASFAHPAKFARGLIECIYDHCLAKGYLKRGDMVGDCFGGIGTGGITAAYRGLNWVGCELEPKFVAMARENFRLHRHGWQAVCGGVATIIQGDSRKFDNHVAGIVSSPPYAETQTTVGNVGNAVYKEYGKASSLGKHDKYGESDGQIGSLKSGAVEAVISSPPFTQGYQSGGGINKHGYGKDGADKVGDRTYQGQGGDRTVGNIETLKEGNVDSVVSSPPYNLPMSQDHNGKRGGKRGTTSIEPGAFAKYGNEAGQIEGLKEGTVQGVISSPPYSDIAAGAGGLNTKPAKKPGQQSGRKAESASQDTDQRYGQSAGQISQLKGGSVDGVVISPPFEGSMVQSGDPNYAHKFHKGQEQYGENTEGQIGKEAGETYWQAVDAVYRACFRAIRPGGVIVLVVKDYCAKGKRVRLCDDTLRLLEHIGFVPLERIHAMLVTETVENGLFGEEKIKKQRKSFFRRLYEAKLPEQDERRIDHEEVIICKRP